VSKKTPKKRMQFENVRKKKSVKSIEFLFREKKDKKKDSIFEKRLYMGIERK